MESDSGTDRGPKSWFGDDAMFTHVTTLKIYPNQSLITENRIINTAIFTA